MEISTLNQSNHISFSGNKPKKEKNTGSIPAILGAYIADKAIVTATGQIGAKQFIKNGNIPADDIVTIHTALKKAMDETGLAKKGVEILKVKENLEGGFDLTTPVMKTITGSGSKLKMSDFIDILPENRATKDLIKNELETAFKNNPLFAVITKVMGKEKVNNMLEFTAKMQTSSLEKGINAFTLLRNNKIVMPELKLSTAGFHEIGHALNANFSKTGKFLQKLRPAALLAFPVMLIGAFGRQKPDSENKVKNAYNKTINFIRDNAGLLAFGTVLPMVIEEGMASFKGNKLAKQMLSRDLASKVAKTNRGGFITYLGMAAAVGIASDIAVRIKNHLQNKHNIKVAAHNAVVSGKVK